MKSVKSPCLAILGAVVLSCVLSFAATAQSTFTNPVVPPYSADPFLTYYQGNYYVVRTPAFSEEVDIYQSPTLGGLKTTSSKPLLNIGVAYESPELWFLQGKWYIYLTQVVSGSSDNIQVLESAGSSPLGPYTSQGLIQMNGYDGDILQMNGNLYLLSTPDYGIFIQPMSSPTVLAKGSSSTQIATQDQVWETDPSGGATFNLMEAPEAVHHNQDYFIFYTVGDYETSGYLVGALKYQGGDPTLAASWTKLPGPLFLGNSANALAAGDCTPFIAADGSWWFTYSAYESGLRSIRVQPMSWDSNGNPVFPLVDPLAGASYSEPVPVGASFTNGPPPATASEHTAYNFTYTTAGPGDPMVTLTAGSLPPGLSLTTAGVLSGTPTAVGTYSGTVTVSNNVGTPPTQHFTIKVSASLNAWESLYFSAAQLANPAISGAAATPQDDGVNNLLKYVYDIDPTVPLSANSLAAMPAVGTLAVSGTSYLTLTYRQYQGLTGTTVNVQTSPDLLNWTTLTLTSGTPAPGTYAQQQAGTDPTTGDPILQDEVLMTGPAQFMRLYVTQP